VFLVTILAIALVLVYFVPTIIASRARKRNLTAIAALNILAGWTVIGWIIALVWALTVDPV
jgi:hypothetical protein